MKCPSPIALSRAVAEGLDDALRAHLDVCPTCSGTLATDAALVEHTRNLPIVVPDASRSANVRASLLAAASAPAPLSLAHPWRAWLAAAGAMVAAAAVIAVLVLRPRPNATGTYAATILPHEGATLLRTSPQPDETVRLVAGTATFQVASLEPGHRFRVITADAEIEGSAAFDVTVDRDHVHSVRVVQGRVEVRAYGQAPRTLVEGERWETTLAAREASGTAPPPETSRGIAVAADDVPDIGIAGGTANRTETATGTGTEAAAAAGTGTGTRVGGDTSTGAGFKPGPRTRGNTVSGGPRAPATGNVTATPKAATRATETREPPRVTTGPARMPAGTTTSPSPAITTAGPSVPGVTRPKRNIEILFDQGWSELAAGKASDAAGTFERAAKSAPDDPLAEDAWFWRASALTRAKSPAAAGALDSFLSRYPHTPRVGEASAMLGWLVIEHDLDRAEALFHAAEHDRVAAVRASAMKGLAAVAERRKR